MEKNKKAYTVFAWAALCLLAFTFIFPLYWIVTGSFKLQTATVQLPPQWFPAEPTAANYVKLFKNPAGLWLWNSVFQAAMATLLTCFTASLAGYACCFSKRMRKVFRKNEKSMLQNCNKKAKRKGRLQRVKKPM